MKNYHFISLRHFEVLHGMKRKSFFIVILFLLLFVSCSHLSPKVLVTENIEPKTSLTTVLSPSLEPHVPDEVSYNQELAAYITVEDGCTITDYADFQGENYRCGVFCLRSPEYETTTSSGFAISVPDLIYWEVVVLRNETVVDVLRIENDEHGDAFPSCENLVTEIDVDFDGNNDLLLCLGHFGNQGAVVYKCWLTRDDTLTYSASFTDITNPALDSEKKEVLSWWRNSAVSHGYGIYRFVNDTFTMAERLTEQPSDLHSDAEEIVWAWTDEIFVDGEWQVREYFTQNDYDKESLYSEKIHGSTAYWDVNSDRWNSLYR